ncbi:MAG: hypothetical protein ABJC61_06110 [Acidobacteriota bacterium]
MGNRGRALAIALGVLVSASVILAADQTWTGKISDSTCGHSHKSAIEHAGKKLTDADCTRACVKGGGKYVFVTGNKVYNIENQDYAGLDANAGASVKLTGQPTGDTIRISSLQGAGKAKS